MRNRREKITQEQYEAYGGSKSFEAQMNMLPIPALENIIDGYDALIATIQGLHALGGDPPTAQRDFRGLRSPGDSYSMGNYFDQAIERAEGDRDRVHLILARKKWELERPRSGARARVAKIIGGC